MDVPNGIQYDGGAGFNTLALTQSGGTETSDTYSVGPNNGQGTDVIVGTAGTQTVDFQNLAPVTDNVPATTATVNATPAANAINYAQGPGGGIFTGNTGIVTVDNEESYEFNNKTSLIINGLAGSDQINLNDPTTPAGLTGSITVNGGDPTVAGDTLTVNGVAGKTDALVYSPTGVGTGSVADGAVQPQVNFTGVENLNIVGQDADGDTLAFNAPATAGLGTVMTYVPGSTSTPERSARSRTSRARRLFRSVSRDSARAGSLSPTPVSRTREMISWSSMARWAMMPSMPPRTPSLYITSLARTGHRR